MYDEQQGEIETGWEDFVPAQRADEAFPVIPAPRVSAENRL